MWANNETGVLFPIEQIAQLTRERNILLHTDAVQAAGKLPIDLRRIPIDLLSLSGHKLHAPAGIGALIVRKGLRLQPQLFGSSRARSPRRHGEPARDPRARRRLQLDARAAADRS
jgi:cysteine desulfurase